MSESTLLNRARLRSVVNGDWEPYTRIRKVCHAPLDWEVNPSLVVNDLCETDFDLLRHDIHVLLYEATR